MAKTVQQGTLARQSIPDSIIFQFMLPGGEERRDLTDYTARITVAHPDDTVDYGRVGTILAQTGDTLGQVRYDFQEADFSVADIGSKTTRVQCTITSASARHISDIASIQVADTPASGDTELGT